MNFQREFNAACEVIQLLNCDQTKFYPDPCDCARYYRCSNNKMIDHTCAEETLWDVDDNNCVHQNQVRFKNDCENEPWSRCNVTEPRKLELRALCTNYTIPITTTPTLTTTQELTTSLGQKEESDGISPGLVIGLIIAGAALAVIIIAVIFVYIRRKKKSKIKRGRSTIAQNPEYFEGGNEQDPYDFINDANMRDPTYQGDPSTLRSNGSAIAAPTGTIDQTTVYDNSAFRESNPASGYTASLSRSQREEQEPPYLTLTRDNNSNQIDANTPNGKSDNEMSAGGVQSENAPDIEGIEPATHSNQETGVPDYYTLNKDQT